MRCVTPISRNIKCKDTNMGWPTMCNHTKSAHWLLVCLSLHVVKARLLFLDLLEKHGGHFSLVCHTQWYLEPHMLSQDWKLNQCSDFITQHGDRAYFIALLIYSNKCRLQQLRWNITYSHSAPPPPLHESTWNEKKEEAEAMGRINLNSWNWRGQIMHQRCRCS